MGDVKTREPQCRPPGLTSMIYIFNVPTIFTNFSRYRKYKLGKACSAYVILYGYSLNCETKIIVLTFCLYKILSQLHILIYYFTWTPVLTSRISIFAKLIFIFRYLGVVYTHLRQWNQQCYMKMLGIFGDWNPRFYLQNPYFCKFNSYFPIFKGLFISICIGVIPQCYMKCLVFLENGTPVF